jgi:hypothetical protein
VDRAVDSNVLYPGTNTREATGEEDLVSLMTQTCGREAEWCISLHDVMETVGICGEKGETLSRETGSRSEREKIQK